MKPDPAPASAGDIKRTLDRTEPTAGATYRLLNVRGFGRYEAGNLTGYIHGLTPVEGGWRLVEIERLLFLRHLVEHGHMQPSLVAAPATHQVPASRRSTGRKDS